MLNVVINKRRVASETKQQYFNFKSFWQIELIDIESIKKNLNLNLNLNNIYMIHWSVFY